MNYKSNIFNIDGTDVTANKNKKYDKQLNSKKLLELKNENIETTNEIFGNKVDFTIINLSPTQDNFFELIKMFGNKPVIILANSSSIKEEIAIETNALGNSNVMFLIDQIIKRTNNSSNKGTQLSYDNPDTDNFLFIKVDYSMVKVCYNEIKFIEGLKDYIKIFVNEKSFITKSTIKNLETKLPDCLFVRVHKSYIVSMNKIDKIENNQIIIGQKRIPIGTQFKDSFYKKIESMRL